MGVKERGEWILTVMRVEDSPTYTQALIRAANGQQESHSWTSRGENRLRCAHTHADAWNGEMSGIQGHRFTMKSHGDLRGSDKTTLLKQPLIDAILGNVTGLQEKRLHKSIKKWQYQIYSRCIIMLMTVVCNVCTRQQPVSAAGADGEHSVLIYTISNKSC